MIKVINVVQDFDMGGIQSVLLTLLRAFKDDPDIDFSVVVLENCRNSEFDKAAREEGLNITYLGASHSKNSHYYIRKIHNFLSYSGKLFFHLLKNHPQIVHTHNTRMIKLIYPCIKRTHKKYIWAHTLHSDPYAVNDAHIPYIKNAVNICGVHPVCLNKTQFEKAKERYGLRSCDYIFNMVNLEKFHNAENTKRACRKALGIPDNAYVIGTVGRMEEVKNYRFLMRVFSVAAKQNERAMLIFTGDGTEREQLEKDAIEYGIADKVLFLGIKKDTEKIYPAFDVFASTSITESSSLVTLEAQAAGVTCVVSSACPKESVISEKVVIMGKDATEKEWAEKLLAPSGFYKKTMDEADYKKETVIKSIKELYRKYLLQKGTK